MAFLPLRSCFLDKNVIFQPIVVSSFFPLTCFLHLLSSKGEAIKRSEMGRKQQDWLRLCG